MSTYAYNENLHDLSTRLKTDHSNDTKPYIVETYRNGASWYRVWSDGWIEQGGYLVTDTSGKGTVTLTKPYSNTIYSILVNGQHAVNSLTNWYGCACKPITNNSFGIVANLSNYQFGFYWETRGY